MSVTYNYILHILRYSYKICIYSYKLYVGICVATCKTLKNNIFLLILKDTMQSFILIYSNFLFKIFNLSFVI